MADHVTAIGGTSYVDADTFVNDGVTLLILQMLQMQLSLMRELVMTM